MNGAITKILVLAALGFIPFASSQSLSIETAVETALDSEPGYEAIMNRAASFEDIAVAESQLPDPMLMMGFLNVPIEDFDLDTEPMNQLRLSVRQQFPKGSSLALKRDRANANANVLRERANNRSLMVVKATRLSWLDTYYWEQARTIVKQDIPLFEQLRETTGTYYKVGRKGLDDVVRAELELQRIKDRLVMISNQIDAKRANLRRWIGSRSDSPLSSELPGWDNHIMERDINAIANQRIVRHPRVVGLDRNIDVLQTNKALAKEAYKPAWSVEVAYAARDARRPNGVSVSDLASVAASISLPLFTGNRQDRRLAAAERNVVAGYDQRLELIRDLTSQVDRERKRFDRLNERIELHRTMILPQAREQYEAALLSYESDKSDFTEVMRSKIAHLEALLVFDLVKVDRLKSLAALRYLIPPDADLALIQSTQEGK